MGNNSRFEHMLSFMSDQCERNVSKFVFDFVKNKFAHISELTSLVKTKYISKRCTDIVENTLLVNKFTEEAFQEKE